MGTYTPKTDDKNKLILGYRNYELTNHLGNVLAVISDKNAQIVSANDYYPFGMVIKSRSFVTEEYRFGFQGQFAEKDAETGWNSFKLRMNDPETARWLSIDPYNQFASPYVSMGNNPINGVDPDGGLFGKWRAQRYQKKHGGEIYQEEDGSWSWKGGYGDGENFEVILEHKNFGYQGLFGRKGHTGTYDDKPVPVDPPDNKLPAPVEKVWRGIKFLGKSAFAMHKANEMDAELQFSNKGKYNYAFNMSFVIDWIDFSFKEAVPTYKLKIEKKVGNAIPLPTEWLTNPYYITEYKAGILGFGGGISIEKANADDIQTLAEKLTIKAMGFELEFSDKDDKKGGRSKKFTLALPLKLSFEGAYGHGVKFGAKGVKINPIDIRKKWKDIISHF